MEDVKITIYDLVDRMIRENQFSAVQEDTLLQLLAGRKEEREKGRFTSKSLFINQYEMVSGTKLIECPYSFIERKAISWWIIENSSDERALACGLWLLGNALLTPNKIINLKSQDAWRYCPNGLDRQFFGNDIKDFYRNMDNAKARERIIQKAVSLHPEDTSYVFMIPRKESTGWKKLSGTVLQSKMRWICNELRIPYKSFHSNEAITFD